MDLGSETVMNVETFYADVEGELAGRRPVPHNQVIPQLPAKDRMPEFDLNHVANKGLWRTIMGMLDSIDSDVPVKIPQDLLIETRAIDIKSVQDEIVAMVRKKPTTIKGLAKRFDFGRVTLAVVFLSCLFLDQERLVELSQAEADVAITAIP
jgi:hypothetical protein